jgi:protocatechuate 3,4-dioxygenase beta subunit
VLAPAAYVLAACTRGKDEAASQPAESAAQTAGGPAAAPAAAARTTTTRPAAGVLLQATPACGDDDDPTPAQMEGPFYTPNSPERTSLLEAGMSGTRLVLTGYVLTRDCQPVAGAQLDFWQCDDRGVYDNDGYRLRGHQFADGDGRYQLETIVPAVYAGRTRHIHVKVQAPNQRVLTTQLYFPNEPANARDGIFRRELVMATQDTADGKDGTFNFVLNV